MKINDIYKMRIETLIAFQKLVENESFSDTAAELGKSQGAISQQLKELEKALGNIELIHRTSQKFEVSIYGKLLYDFITEYLEKFTTTIKKINTTYLEKSYTINIATSSIPGEFILPKRMIAFQQKYPKTHFNLQIDNSLTSIQKLLEGTVDFCAIGGFFNYSRDLFEYKIIDTDLIVIIARNNHPIFKRENIREELYNYPWIFREKGSATRDLFLEKFPNSDDLNIALEFQDNTAILTAIKASNALTALSFNLITGSCDNNLYQQITVPNCSPIKRNLYLIRLKSKKMKTYETSFWNYL